MTRQIAALDEQCGALTFASAVQALQRACANDSPVGFAGPAEREAILFRAAAMLGFPAADVVRIAERPAGNASSWLAEMEVTFLGLYGPASPLPTAWTEDIVQNADGAQNLRDFLDLFNHPLIALAYRIGRHYRIDRQFDATLNQALPRALLALAGQFGGTALAKSVDWPRLLPLCGLLAHAARSPRVIEQIVSGYFAIPVAVEEWVTRMVPIPPDQQFVLGTPGVTLGEGTVLGDSVPDRAGAITLVLGPLPRDDFASFLPQGSRREELHALLRMTLRQPVACYIDLLLEPTDGAGLVLGQAQLGWTSWQGSPAMPRCPTGVLEL